MLDFLLGNVMTADDDSSSSSDDEDITLSDAVMKFFAAVVREHLLHPPTSGNVNRHLDRLLLRVRRYIIDERLDPYEEYDLSDEMKYFYVEGLRTVRRTGAATVQGKDNFLVLDAKIGFRKFSSEVEFKSKLWWIYWIGGILYMDSEYFDIRLRFSMRLHTDSLRFYLHHVIIDDWSKVDTQFSGTNCVGSVISCYGSCSPCIRRRWIRKNVPKMIRDAVNDVLEDQTIFWSELSEPVSKKKRVTTLKAHTPKKKPLK